MRPALFGIGGIICNEIILFALCNGFLQPPNNENKRSLTAIGGVCGIFMLRRKVEASILVFRYDMFKAHCGRGTKSIVQW